MHGSDPAFTLPAYGQRSPADVLPSVAQALGVEVLGPSPLQLPEAARYVVFLVDGLGYELLRRHPADAPFLHSLLADGVVGTATVPSTTVTSLTSFGTALLPGTHGMVGYTSRVPGTDHLLNALQWDAPVDPTVWQPHETAFSRLTAAGVHIAVVSRPEFAGSGLTRASQRGARFASAADVEERLAGVLEHSRSAPSITYVYEGDLDYVGHRYGVASATWTNQLAMVDAEAEQLRESLPADTRLLVVADHGMLDSPDSRRVELDAEPALLEGVSLVGGEIRFRYLYCRPGAVEEVAAAWRERLGPRADVLLREQAVSLGWFGEVRSDNLERIGDVVVACREDFAVQWSSVFPLEHRMIGVHGSLTAAEMLIPILVA